MGLGASQGYLHAGSANGQPAVGPGRRRGAQRVRVETRSGADPARTSPAVAHVYGNGAVGMARHNPGWRVERPPSVSELDDIHEHLAVLASPPRHLVGKPKLLRR